MIQKVSSIQVTENTKNELKKLKMTKGESYENVILRLINAVGDDLSNERSYIIVNKQFETCLPWRNILNYNTKYNMVNKMITN